jgi:hypothetical protein
MTIRLHHFNILPAVERCLATSSKQGLNSRFLREKYAMTAGGRVGSFFISALPARQD